MGLWKQQRWKALAAAALATAVTALRGQNVPDYELPPVSYSASTPHDAFAVVQAKIASGELRFAGDEKQVVHTLLAALGVPVATQTVVFSRTSFQRDRIRPDHPRALYFSDSVYVGWLPGGLIEIAAVDPMLGPVFYSLDLREAPAGPSKISRDEDCMRCHGGTFVRDIPGLFVRSVFRPTTSPCSFPTRDRHVNSPIKRKRKCPKAPPSGRAQAAS